MRRKKVCMQVDEKWYDNEFWKAKENLRKQMGLDRLTNIDFTNILYRNNIKLKVPINKIGRTNVKQKRRRK